MDIGSSSLRICLRAGLTTLVVIAALRPHPAEADTFAVTKTADTGAGTLRQALLDAQASPGADVITFDLPGSAPFTIAPKSALPTLTGPVTIDGTTQPGYAGTPVVELRGSSAGAGANGLYVATSNCLIKALCINRFSANGILIEQGGSNVIRGCFIGTDDLGTGAAPNALAGITIRSENNLIGGTSPSDRNIISGNSREGVLMDGTGAFMNRIQGNKIGTDESGMLALGNALQGIAGTSAPSNTVGGVSAGAGNLVSGNGLTAGGGIYLTDPGTRGWVIQGNFIGTTVDGSGDLGNALHGIEVRNGSSGHWIGGTTAGAGNRIAYAHNAGGYDGVRVRDGSTNVLVVGNSIFANGGNSTAGLGIDLGADGVTANDACDPDTGGNLLQNFPVLTQVDSTDFNTVISGALNSAANGTYRLHFYANSANEPSGFGEGEVYLGEITVQTAANCSTNFTATLPVGTPAGSFVTATATDAANNTSEFSQATATTWTPVAQELTWTNLSGGSWSTAANWSPNRVPGLLDTVLITQAGTYTVTLDTNAAISQLTVGGASGLQRLAHSAGNLTVSETGTIATGGVLDLAVGSTNTAAAWQVAFGGTLSGGGTLVGSVTNSGFVAPGASPGRLRITGHYIQTVEGSLQIELAGVDAGTNHDRLDVSGTAQLDGSLDVALTEGFYPPTGASFTFLTCATLAGTWPTFSYPSNDVGLELSYTPTNASLGVVNVHPELAAIADDTIDELTLFSLAVTASDADQPTQNLTFALLGAPAEASINPTNGLLTWTPSEADGPTTNTFTVQVTDDGTPNLVASQTFQVVVNEVNTPPQLTAPTNQVVNEQTLLSLNAVANDSDLPANGLTFGLVSPPDGLTIDPANGAITWTPSEAQGSNTYMIVVTLTDSNAAANNETSFTVTNTFEVVVNEINEAPVLPAIGDQTVQLGAGLTLVSTATDTDLPPNALNYMLVGPPAGAAVDGNGIITWTPSAEQISNAYPFTLVVSDSSPDAVNAGSLSATNSFQVTVVESNRPPVLIVPERQTVDELTPLAVSASATDPDTPPSGLVFGLVSPPEGLTIDPVTGALNWTPTEAQGSNIYTLTVTVSETNAPSVHGTELSATNSFEVVVNEVNTAPELPTVADQTVNEGELLTVVSTATDTDLPTNVLSYQLLSPPTGASVDAKGVIQWTPTEAQGSNFYTLTVVVSDTNPDAANEVSLSTTNTFGVVVNEVNTPPQLTVPTNQVVNEQTLLSLSAVASDPDLPANGLTFGLVSPPEGLTIDPTSGAMTWTPSEAQGSNTYTIAVTLTDSNAAAINEKSFAVTNTFEIAVDEVNSAPVLPVVADQTVYEGELLTVVSTATDNDLPTNALNYLLLDPPAGVTVDGNGLIEWTPTEGQGSNFYTLTIVVTDTNPDAVNATTLSATNTFGVTVLKLFKAPVIVAQPASVVALVGSDASFKVSASGDSPLGYRWRRNSADLIDGGNILGSASANLTISNLQITDVGGYSVIVTNPHGVVTSAVAVLTVWPASAPTGYAYTNFAGLPGNRGNADGSGKDARFYRPEGVAVDSVGIIYVADTDNHILRKITPDGTVTTLAGKRSTAGSADGTGSEARFAAPRGIAVDGDGNVYVADWGNHAIRKVTPDGVVTTLAGSLTNSGSADGVGDDARFNYPTGVALDSATNLYVADTGNHTIRKVTAAGEVTKIAGSAGTSGSTDGTGFQALFDSPEGVAVAGPDLLYVADSRNHTIRSVTSAGVVTTLAGTPGELGIVDGVGSSARFNFPRGLVVDSMGDLCVVDSGNYTLRKVTSPGEVTTLAGAAGVTGSTDGLGDLARFNFPRGIAVNNAGQFYVTDSQNHTLRSVTVGGLVTTLAGSAVNAGSADGSGSDARFYLPYGVAADSANNVYVADTYNQTIRKITPAGEVSTLAGQPLSWGTNDGPATVARFNYPFGVAADNTGNVYVAEYANHTIRKVTPSGDVTTLAGLAFYGGTNDGPGNMARFRYPLGLAVDEAGFVYVADQYNHSVRKVTPTGEVTTLAGLSGSSGSADGLGSAARFTLPRSVAVDTAGNVFVSDTRNHTIRKITPEGDVTTLAGSPGLIGSEDGIGSAARFNFPWGLTVDRHGNILVADSRNHTLRKVTPSGVVTTIGGLVNILGGADGVGTEARFSYPAGVAVDSLGYLLVADSENNRISCGTPLFTSAPPPEITIDVNSLTFSPSGFSFKLIGPAGQAVVVQASSNLLDWLVLQTNILGSGPFYYFDPGASVLPLRFYRAVTLP